MENSNRKKVTNLISKKISVVTNSNDDSIADNSTKSTSNSQIINIPMITDSNDHSITANSTQSHPDSETRGVPPYFECPVCFEYILPPALQCENGHLICKSCRQQIKACPTCRIKIKSNIRNLVMDDIASTISFPCKYSTNGCKNSYFYADKAKHEKNCPFKSHACPCPGTSCKWQGPTNQVMAHLMKQHKSITNLEGEDIVFLATDINLSGAVDWLMIQSCFSHHFMLLLEKQEKYGREIFYAVVLIIGSEKEAENFIYRLELYNSTKRKRISWESKPNSIVKGVQSAINNVDSFMFSNELAQEFSEGGNLGINVTISRIDNTTNNKQ